MIELKARAEPLLAEDAAPYVLVVLQECERMNRLLSEIRRSLIELRKGLDGQLNMSDPMEDLLEALSINQVPGRNVFSKVSWEKLAWPSKKTLEAWFQDVLLRVEQLERWSTELVTPFSLWLPGLFNPMAFVTAIMQVTARDTGRPLDKMTVETHITTIYKPEHATEYPEHGKFVHGLYIEGARWPTVEELAGETSTVGTTTVAGHLVDSKLKDLMPQLPLVYLRAVEVDPDWEATEVGYLRHDPSIFECPIYVTTFRGPTYVLLATLKTIQPPAFWVHRGVAIVLQTD
jgi:dynein heavy chain